jgi:hypothetical protein
MHRSTIIAVPLALVWVAVLLIPAHADEKGQLVTISWPIEFTETSGVSENVKTECSLPGQVPQYIKRYAKKMNVVLANDVSDNTEGWVLHVEIVNVIGTGGGAWSGSKSVTVEGKLTENGEVIGTFTARRNSGGGFGGGFKGTCSILGRCIKAIGSDIAKWLANPTMDAKLG